MGIVNEADRRNIAAAEGETDSPPTTEDEVELAREYASFHSNETHPDSVHRQNRRFAAFKLLLKAAPQISELSKHSDLEKLDAYISAVR